MKPASPLRRRLLILAALVVLFTITGFFILPPIIKSQLEKRFSATLGRRVTVEKVRLNPYTLALTLENFAIQDQAGTALFVGWKKLHVDFDARHRGFYLDACGFSTAAGAGLIELA